MSDRVGAGAGSSGRGAAPQPLPRAHPPQRALPSSDPALQRIQVSNDKHSRYRAVVPYQPPQPLHVDANVVIATRPMAARTSDVYYHDLAPKSDHTSKEGTHEKRVKASIANRYDSPQSSVGYSRNQVVPGGSKLTTPRMADGRGRHKGEINLTDDELLHTGRREFILGPYDAGTRRRSEDTSYQMYRDDEFGPNEIVNTRRELVPYHDQRIAPYNPNVHRTGLPQTNYNVQPPIPAVRHKVSKHPSPVRRQDFSMVPVVNTKGSQTPFSSLPESVAVRITPPESIAAGSGLPIPTQQQLQQQQLQETIGWSGLFGATPRTIVIERPQGQGFGFTLRHLVVYPPVSLTEACDGGGRLAAVGALCRPMDTVFVRRVRAGGPAAAAGVRAGDRVVAVAGEPAAGARAAPYARLVHLIRREPDRLRITVVPKEADLLQRYFSEAAYNPETNQRQQTSTPLKALEDAKSTKELTAENAYAEPNIERGARQTATPSHRRRVSEGTTSDSCEYASVSGETPPAIMESLATRSLRAPPAPHSIDDDRRESNVSLLSVATDGKDSLSSFDSSSTMTGREADDAAILSRIRKSLEQKEAFLRRPSQPTGWVTPEDLLQQRPLTIQKEFFARPQKLQKPLWPPTNVPSLKSTDENQPENNDQSEIATTNDSINDETISIESKSLNSNKDKNEKGTFVATLSKIQELTPSSGDSIGSLSNGSPVGTDMSPASSLQDGRYPIPAEFQIVTNRTRQFESPQTEDKTALYRSELARLSTKKAELSIALRRKDFETRGSGGNNGNRREARSLDVQSSQDEAELEAHLNASLSGNRLMIVGSKHLHCPPPEGYRGDTEKVQMRTRSNSTGSEGIPMRRTHTSSDGSHMKRRLALNKEQLDAINNVPLEMVEQYRKNAKQLSEDAAANRQVPNGFNAFKNKDSARLANGHKMDNSIQMFVNGKRLEQSNFSPGNGVPGGDMRKPERPKHLNLTPTNGSFSANCSPITTPSSPGYGIEETVTRRQKAASHIAEEERAMRRVSYLKATWGDRLHMDSDIELSDTEPQQMRSADKKSEETLLPHCPSDDDAALSKKITIEGTMQVKMVLMNGKRASDRSWKQVWAVLQGPKLILYRHHQNQSPMSMGPMSVGGAGVGNSGGAGVGAGVGRDALDAFDLRYSMAAAAGDYTKRKHVLRVTCAAGAELLLRADSAADAQRWLGALRTHAHAPRPSRVEHSGADAHNDASIIVPQNVETQSNLMENSLGGLSPLPPQRTKKVNRNRSPTGPPTPTLPSSPKTKTWKGRMAKQLRKMHGGSSNTSGGNTTTQGGWLDSPLERWSEAGGRGVPSAVRACAAAVEARGLHTVGVYRVPGNAAGVAALAAALDTGEPPPPDDPRWADVHVASSLLKSFFRRLPDSLLTAELYPAFVAADREPCAAGRARALRRLVRALPDPHYDTLEFLVRHLRKVAAESEHNKMEARNLAIVFGPTLVRGADDDMLTMVNDMSSQCRIVESLINHYEWYFDEDERASPEEEPPGEDELTATTVSRAVLIRNAKKIEAKSDVSTKDIVSSIISAANRKIQRKPRSKPSSIAASKKIIDGPDRSPSGSRRSDDKLDGSDETLESGSGEAIGSSREPIDEPNPSSIPYHYTQSLAEYDGLPFRSYTGLNQTTQERIKRFEMETKAMLQREKRRDLSHYGEWSNGSPTQASPVSSNKIVHKNTTHEKQTKAAAANLVAKEIAAIANAGKRLKTSTASLNSFSIDGAGDLVTSLTDTFDKKLRTLNNSSPLDDASIPYADDSQDECTSKVEQKPTLLLPTVNAKKSSSINVSSTKEKESEEQSLPENGQNKLSDGIKCNYSVDEKVSTYFQEDNYDSEKENYNSQKSDIPHSKTCKSSDKCSKSAECNKDNEKDVDSTGSVTSQNDEVPDNDKNISQILSSPTYSVTNFKISKNNTRYSNPECVKRNSAVLDSDGESHEIKSNKNDVTSKITNKLKRSESLNRESEKRTTMTNNKVLRSESLNYKADKGSPARTKLQRSESLNKAENRQPLSNDKINRSESLNRSDFRLKRSDSLTKNEKTESNILKKREQNGGLYRPTKLKRKNGMPERSIKRRHTVGGTKDFDKDGWMDKHSRTSSPDLTDVKLLTSLDATSSPMPLESHV